MCLSMHYWPLCLPHFVNMSSLLSLSEIRQRADADLGNLPVPEVRLAYYEASTRSLTIESFRKRKVERRQHVVDVKRKTNLPSSK